MSRPFTFYEFFAGGGMARAGLGPGWTCLFANDLDAKKVASYRANWGDGEMRPGDVHALSAEDLPGRADLAWASFPCQDLSLAGAGAGLNGARSGAFWGLWTLMRELAGEGRAPTVLVVENVTGLLTSRGGRDFAQLCAALADLGYVYGALTIDAAQFVPQSRPRLFIVAVRDHEMLPDSLAGRGAAACWVSDALLRAECALPRPLRDRWRWWALPSAPDRILSLHDLIEAEPVGVAWHSAEHTARLLSMMSGPNGAKLAVARASGRSCVGTLYRRTRKVGATSVQRAEVRFDGVAGCLRTPRGGSSRQTLLVVDGERVRSRLLSPREAARLMGLPDNYTLPERYNDAYHLAGDGVAAPVVRFLAAGLVEPLCGAGRPAAQLVAAA